MIGAPNTANWGCAEATGGAIYVLLLTLVFTLFVCAALGCVGWLAGHWKWLGVGGWFGLLVSEQKA